MMTISEPLRKFCETLPDGWRVMSFEQMLAGPVCNGVYKSKEFHGRGARVVNMGELFGNDFISDQEMKRVELTEREKSKLELEDGDLLFARRSLVLEGAGKCALVIAPPEPTTFESSIIRARPRRDLAVPRFLFYLFASPLGRAIVASIATRTAVSGIRGSDLSILALPLPPLAEQRRIADILSAYDDLIENSQCRIRILEQMARALYREWFVHFRFPGHAKYPRVPSPLGDIPQGWEVSEFRYLFDIRYGKTLPKAEIFDAGPYPVYGAGDVIGFYDKVLCQKKCALVTSRGNGSGTVWRTREPAFVTNNSLIMLPRKEHRHWDYSFIELLLRHANVMEAKTGSAQPQVTIENLNYVKAIVPAKALVERFCAIATPICEQVDSLVYQIQNLRRTRNLLLSRLLAGQSHSTNSQSEKRF